MQLTLVVSLVLLAIATAFKPLGVTLVRASTARSLFGSPEPRKDEIKKDAGGGGMFGGMGNIMDQMKKAQEIAKKAEQMNKELMNVVVQGQDPSGGVIATYNGLGVPISMRLSDAILAQGEEAASLAASQAMVDGYTKSQSMMMSRMQAMYAESGVNLPKV
jgi:DNA-binding protein YbaB